MRLVTATTGSQQVPVYITKTAKTAPLQLPTLVQAPVASPVHTYPDKPQHAQVTGWLSDGLVACALQPTLRASGCYTRTVCTPTGGALHVLESPGIGPLPPVVILPGLGGRTTDYSILLWRLRRHCQRVLVMDLPGLGRSDDRAAGNFSSFHQAIAEGLDQLLPGPFVLLGHSLGGDAALRYAIRSPERLAGVIAYSPPSGPYDQPIRDYIRRLFSVPTQQEARYVGELISNKSSKIFAQLLWARLSTPGAQALIQGDVMGYCPTVAELARLPPCMVVAAEHERLIPPLGTAYYRQALPSGSEIALGVGLSHTGIAAGPRNQVDLILDFMRRRTAMRGD